jgi:hypothetical protein
MPTQGAAVSYAGRYQEIKMVAPCMVVCGSTLCHTLAAYCAQRITPQARAKIIVKSVQNKPAARSTTTLRWAIIS